MFGDSLLQVSPASRNNKRWSMATALIVELVVAGIAISIPLLTTGVLPMSARVPLFAPIKPVTIDTMRPVPAGQTRANLSPTPASRVVLLNNNSSLLHYGPTAPLTSGPSPVTPPDGFTGGTAIPSDLISGPSVNVRPGPGPKRIVSVLEEAQLINRVEPVYPHIAIVTGIQGQVKLRAIIARDGTVQSLNVVSGHPLLARAAVDAVSQWRYRPYVLNGEIVEVETLITVNFKKNSQ